MDLVNTTGRPVAEIADELGIYDSTLGNWVKQDRVDRGEREGLSSDERARLREVEAEKAKLRMERDLLKRTVALLPYFEHEADEIGRGEPMSLLLRQFVSWPELDSRTPDTACVSEGQGLAA